MKQRIITGIILLLIVVPIFLAKMLYDINDFIYFLGFVLAVIAMNEMISVKENEKTLPFEVHLLAYLAVIYIGFAESINTIFTEVSIIEINILPFLLILLMLIVVFRRNFKFSDAGFILFSVLYIGLAFNTLVKYFLKTNGMYELLYVILIAIFTDTFAYFTGTFFGKHKLCPQISPKKTIEGSLGGTIIATILVTIYVLVVDKIVLFNSSLIFIIGLTIVLSIISQFGDLAMSVIKRQYRVKDYGNIFPGHGGVLDRLDSILFTSLAFYYINELLVTIF